MGMVRVWNKNVHDYKEKFRDDHIHIKAGQYILMESEQANIFRGTFSPIVLDADGNKIAEGFKMISIEPIGVEDPPHVDHKEWSDKMALMNEGAELVVDEMAEAELKTRKRK